MIDWIRNQVIERSVKRAGAAAKEFVEWNGIKTICFLASRDEFYNQNALNAFIKRSEKTSSIILFAPSPVNIIQAEEGTYTKKQLSLLGLPKAGVLDAVTSASYDLLVDCNFNSYPSMKWLAGTAKAKFKVGPAGLPYDNYFDICIDLKNDRNWTTYLEQVENYLKMIRTKNA